MTTTCLDGYQEGTVYINPSSGAATYKSGFMDKTNGTAFGYYNNTLNETGWGILELYSQCAACRDTDAMFAAGFLEGVLTARYTTSLICFCWLQLQEHAQKLSVPRECKVMTYELEPGFVIHEFFTLLSLKIVDVPT